MTDLPKNIKNLEQKTYSFAFRIGIIFFLTSITGVVLGNFLDANVFSRPTGTLISMAICYVITWVFIWRIYKQFKITSKSTSETNSSAKEI